MKNHWLAIAESRKNKKWGIGIGVLGDSRKTQKLCIESYETNLTITPNLAYTDTITFSDGGVGGTFNPASLSWTVSSSPMTFTYTPPSTGTCTVELKSP
jgi:hypothetical protein